MELSFQVGESLIVYSCNGWFYPIKSTGINMFFLWSTNYGLEINLISVRSVMLNFVFFRKRSNFDILIAHPFYNICPEFLSVMASYRNMFKKFVCFSTSASGKTYVGTFVLKLTRFCIQGNKMWLKQSFIATSIKFYNNSKRETIWFRKCVFWL